MRPIIKYPGGKERELPIIKKLLPVKMENYYEPFLGGGAVFLGIEGFQNAYINDKSNDLINLYLAIKGEDSDFYEYLQWIEESWRTLNNLVVNNIGVLMAIYRQEVEVSEAVRDFILNNNEEFFPVFEEKKCHSSQKLMATMIKCVVDKFKRMKAIEKKQGSLSEQKDYGENIECAFKRSYYTHLRWIFNQGSIKSSVLSKGQLAALYYFIREYCYSSMFRYNASGEFNVPYGGISYNRKYLSNKIALLKSEELRKKLEGAIIERMDFREFFQKYPVNRNDFVFLDPPYDSDFSDYANNAFDCSDQKRLAEYLINHCEAKWMLIIKNTDLISSLYPEGKTTRHERIRICAFDKKYSVSFKNRNDKDCEHLVIMNYIS